MNARARIGLRPDPRAFAHVAITEELIAVDGADREDLLWVVSVNVCASSQPVTKVSLLERQEIQSRMLRRVVRANQEAWSG